jgi:hypothetical protein
MSCLHYLRLFAHSGVQHILCCVFCFVCLRPVSCVPNVVSFSNTICVGHHCVQTNANNVNKTSAVLQTTGGKDEPNMFFVVAVEIETNITTRNDT